MKRWADSVFDPQPLSPLPLPAEIVCRVLAPLVLDTRMDRITRAVESRSLSVISVIESLSDPHNAAAILRTCDALGVHEVHAIEAQSQVRLTHRVSKGVEKWMRLQRHSTPAECAKTLRDRGYKLYVADMRADITLEQIAQQPQVALAFGNEHAGISDELMACADGAFCIPMTGMVESFNVSVAAGIALFAATRNRPGNLSPSERAELRARFLMESIRGAEHVLERAAKAIARGEDPSATIAAISQEIQ
ncbi:MAG: RNA methyltransferase [Deltaproteobacteria bacterium]|nr:RNA methyltransferase [Deltaproteobacteria bacterium]